MKATLRAVFLAAVNSSVLQIYYFIPSATRPIVVVMAIKGDDPPGALNQLQYVQVGSDVGWNWLAVVVDA